MLSRSEELSHTRIVISRYWISVRYDNMGKMSTERTPLITNVTVGSVPRRYPHQTLRRFCSIALGSTLVALFITFLVSGRFSHHNGQWPGHHRSHVTPEELQSILLETPSGEKAGEWSKYYTSGPHLAGKNLSQVCNMHNGDRLGSLTRYIAGRMDSGSME